MENVQATTGAKAGAKTVTKRRVKLISTDDTYTHIQRGTCGTVDLIDAMGTLHVSWVLCTYPGMTGIVWG